jgi:cyclic lactone autoinducer peptide
MKVKLSDMIKKTLKGVAIISSGTTSTFGLYQPKTPECMLKHEKKK